MLNGSSSAMQDSTRFSPIRDDNKAGILWIASLLSGIYALLSLAVRLYIKRKVFGCDDWICLAATIAGVGSFVATYIGLAEGLGNGLVHDAGKLQAIGRTVFASRIAFVVGVFLAKASVVCLIKRLFSQDMLHHRMLCNVVLVATTIWAIGALVGVSIRCVPRDLIRANNISCTRQPLRWQIIGAFDAITELLIMFLSCGLVWRLQMRMELKIRVILAFLFRLPLVAMSAIHIYYIHAIPQSDTNLHIIPTLAIEQIQLGYGLVSATIPNLKSFVISFDTSMMMAFDDYRVELVGSSHSAVRSKSSPERPPSSRHSEHSDASSQDAFLRDPLSDPSRPLSHVGNAHDATDHSMNSLQTRTRSREEMAIELGQRSNMESMRNYARPLG